MNEPLPQRQHLTAEQLERLVLFQRLFTDLADEGLVCGVLYGIEGDTTKEGDWSALGSMRSSNRGDDVARLGMLSAMLCDVLIQQAISHQIPIPLFHQAVQSAAMDLAARMAKTRPGETYYRRTREHTQPDDADEE